MVLQYFGLGMIKASVGDEVLCFAPIAKDGDVKGPQFGANIALVPLNNDKNYNGIEQVTHAPREPFLIAGPGEYEINGTFVRGVPSESLGGAINTIYSVLLDDIRLCHLGALSGSLSAEVKASLGEIDVLFVPIYSPDLLDEASAYKLASSLEPKIIVPLFIGKNKSESLVKFLKEAGETKLEAQDKFTFKKKDLEDKDGEIVVLDSN